MNCQAFEKFFEISTHLILCVLFFNFHKIWQYFSKGGGWTRNLWNSTRLAVRLCGWVVGRWSPYSTLMLYIKPQPHHLKQTRLCLMETVPITLLIYCLISRWTLCLDHLPTNSQECFGLLRWYSNDTTSENEKIRPVVLVDSLGQRRRQDNHARWQCCECVSRITNFTQVVLKQKTKFEAFWSGQTRALEGKALLSGR